MKPLEPRINRRCDGQNATCAGCSLRESRREFLSDLALTLGAVVATLGMTRRADALVVRLGTATSVNGNVASYPVPSADGVVIDKSREVILVRWEGALYAFRLSCPHQRTALKWKDKDGRFQCPKHGSRYRPDGTFISGRATRGMDRYAISRDGDNVRVDLSRCYLQDENGTAWSAAAVQV